jgi:kynurenine formamidase
VEPQYSRREIPGWEQVSTYLDEKCNWGRWGSDDQAGTVNLITPEKRRQAAALVRAGISLSLSRPLDGTPGPLNPRPFLHFMETREHDFGWETTRDFIAMPCHAYTNTHIDALGHIAKDDQLWGGRSVSQSLRFDGLHWGSVEMWKDGIVTRGVLLDIPHHRGGSYVSRDQPVHGWELDDICAEHNLVLSSGDALLVYCGRDKWEDDEDPATVGSSRPGLHASCLKFIRDRDVSVLVWDMLDARPAGYPAPWTIHIAIQKFGLAVIDSADLSQLSSICSKDNTYEFMFVASPLLIGGGTGSPINPLVIL